MVNEKNVGHHPPCIGYPPMLVHLMSDIFFLKKGSPGEGCLKMTGKETTSRWFDATNSIKATYC
jgi:hypothetical protein